MNSRWDIFRCSAELKEHLSKQLDIPPLIAQLLIKRGIIDPHEGEKFLSPSLSHLYDPFLMKDVDKGVERIIKAIKEREKVLVYGDYDVDGISACALLVDFLNLLGIQPSYYIPHRLKEGYGLNPEAIKSIAAQGINLLICVDCGISDQEEIKLAQQLGMDTIVVDHHEVPAQLSSAYAVLNPLQPDCPFPFKGLAGVGVSFNLVVALRSRLRSLGFWRQRQEPNLRRYLDLVALGTIADIVPLVDMNRILVKYGLEELENCNRPGILALKEISGIGMSAISTGQVAFRLAPRINAAGRVSRGQIGVELLLTKDHAQAAKIAEELERANRERQDIEGRIYRESKDIIQREGLMHRSGFVLSSDNWHPGVIGIVASKLAEEFWQPTILIAIDGEEGKGSARSIVGFNLYECLKECGEHLLGFGGHKYAAGIKIRRDKLKIFTESFERIVRGKIAKEGLIRTIFIDAEVELREFTPELIKNLSLLQPYGPANPKPFFSTKEKLPISDIRIVGEDSLKFKLKEAEGIYEIIGFGMGYLAPILPLELKIAFYPQMNDWRGVKSLQLELKAVELDQEG
jgi:single-stranded-DNA-specific exonuclease